MKKPRLKPLYDNITYRNVEIYVEFFRICEIDNMNERFVAEVIVEARWIEPDLVIVDAANANTITATNSTKTVITTNNTKQPTRPPMYDPDVHWNPKLFIENMLQEQREQVVYEVKRRVKDGCWSVLERKHIKGVFWEKLELHNFPLDIQELSVILSSRLSLTEVKLMDDSQRKSNVSIHATRTFVEQQKWKLFRLVKVSEHASYDLDNLNNIINDITKKNNLQQQQQHSQNQTSKEEEEDNNQSISSSSGDLNNDYYESEDPANRPKLVASCFCARKAGYYLFNAYFLIFLITASSITIFSIDCKLPQSRLQTSYTLLLTSISFKWVINRSLPAVSYLTSLDKYAIASIFYICLLCVWHSMVGGNALGWSSPEQALVWDKWLLVVFSCLFVLFHAVCFLYYHVAYRKVKRIKAEETEFLKSMLAGGNFHV